MSGIYLFTALYFLFKFARDDYQVNIKAMILHATSFALYMASALLCMYAFVMWRYLLRMTDETYHIIWGITYICLSLSQAVLCIVFWKLGKERPLQQRNVFSAAAVYDSIVETNNDTFVEKV